MGQISISQEIEELTAKNKALSERRAQLFSDKSVVQAELETRRRDLKRSMEACREAGYDPNNLADELKRKIEVERVKQESAEADISAAEAIIRPMLEEVRKG